MQRRAAKPRLSDPRETRRDLDSMDFEKLGKGLRVFQPDAANIEVLLENAGKEIPGLATVATVMAVFRHNPETIFAIAREDGAVTGFIAQLPLNAEGHARLRSGVLDTANPDLACIARQNERPDAIYIWCIFVSAMTSGAISLVMERLSSRKYARATLYCRAASEKSRSFFLTLGFQETEARVGALMRYERIPAEAGAGPAGTPEVSRPIAVSVCRTLSDYQKIIAIRAATYIGEHDCPYDEEFDGNDLSGLHLVGTYRGEPSACLRIRFFSGFAKIERLAVLKGARKSALATHMIREAIALCRRKGYRHIYGQCEPRVAKLWMRQGFRPRTDIPTFRFSDRDYLEGDLFLEAHGDAITAWSDPLVIIRPEGAWDEAGVLDRSGERPVSPLHAMAHRLREADELLPVRSGRTEP